MIVVALVAMPYFSGAILFLGALANNQLYLAPV
uniref:Uncharacterized protein n=1 Tax=Arundo donax TaxID=35708 RepID=A0A0A9A6L7_ARUDO